MHRTHPPQVAGTPAPPCLRSSRQGFSLVEITLAIGIIAFAFVALFGLLPSGMNTFRSAVDETNEGRIVEQLTTMIQAAEFDKIGPQFDFTQASGVVYYFDEEGNLIRAGTSKMGGLDPVKEQPKVTYAAKLFLVNGWTVTADPKNTPDPKNSKNVMLAMANVSSASYRQFDEDITSLATFQNLLYSGKIIQGIRLRTMILAKMDGQPTS